MRVLETLSVNKEQDIVLNDSHQYTKRMPLTRLGSFAATSNVARKCSLCDLEHSIAKCPRFIAMHPIERHRTIMNARLCLNCLRDNHRARDCSSQYKCRHCNSQHHTMLHTSQDHSAGAFSTAMPAASNRPAASDHPANLQRTFAAAMERAPTQVLLQTAIINIVDSFGLVHSARALLDSASQPDMMSSQLANRLKLKKKKVNVILQGAGQSIRPLKESVHAKIASRTQQFEAGVEFLIVEKLMANLPLHDINTTGWNIPSELVLADPEFFKSSAIDIILGARHYASFFEGSAQVKLAPTLPTLQESVFGWVVTGSFESPELTDGASNVAHTTAVVCMKTLEESIERFWKSEELWVNDGYSPDERHCEAIDKSTTQRDPSGRYIVRLPKQPDFFDKLGLSKDMALNRFTLLERRLQRDPGLKEEYHKFMKEYLELKHMSLTTPTENDHGYYLPHHPVLKASSSTTKLRVVFDGSAKTSTGYSLNEALRVGPVVQDDLLDIILRFRTYKVALVGDIAKMYRQIVVHPDDRRFQRVLFRFSPDDSVETYELNTVTYGLSPSSFLATRTLLQLAEDEGSSFPHAAQALAQNFCVDDFIGGADSVEQAQQLREELSQMLNKGGFSLRKWTSNQLAVLSGLTEDQIGTQSTLQFMPDEKIKALGIAWEPEADVLSFESRIDAATSHPTCRLIFSGISRMFDPIGLISPIIIRAKLLMQELWVQKSGWDNPVSDSIYKKWTSIKSDWPIISGYKSDRYALLPDSRVQLHTFCDASEAAFGACIYARCENNQGQVRISLLASKSRLAPLKRITLPRLALNAAVTGAHLYERVRQAMRLDSVESYFWSDSTVTLHWLSSPPNNWKTYVGNRVAEVQNYTHQHPWKHIAGCFNPADLVSRGVTEADFVRMHCGAAVQNG
uniref:Peptidase aspartic putative domain-containing protein n=1 Tax=Anopheles atroparvus TaxID=41427 RepID=A0AAG5DRE2_ANOAO